MSYGRFEAAYLDKRSQLRKRFERVIVPLISFQPTTRPVFWRMLVTQAHIYVALLQTAVSKTTARSPTGH